MDRLAGHLGHHETNTDVRPTNPPDRMRALVRQVVAAAPDLVSLAGAVVRTRLC